MVEKEIGLIKVVRQDRYAKVILNRPEKLNALSPELIHDLLAAWEDVAGDETVRSVIITGAGKSFSAGGDAEKDINPLRQKGVTEFRNYFQMAEEMYKGIIESEKPVIAAINGYAVGAGMDLALACDIRIAAEDAKMGEFFVRMGLTPEIGVYFLPRLVGLGRAKLICLTGDVIEAEEAERIGLVEKITPPDMLIPAAEDLAKRLAAGPVAVGIINKAIDQSLNMSLESSMDYLARLQFQLSRTKDHEEAITAFLEKRPPRFTGE